MLTVSRGERERSLSPQIPGKKQRLKEEARRIHETLSTSPRTSPRKQQENQDAANNSTSAALKRAKIQSAEAESRVNALNMAAAEKAAAEKKSLDKAASDERT